MTLKRLLCTACSLLLCLVLSGGTKAQSSYPEFAPIGAKWTYLKYELSMSGESGSTTHLTSIKDDTIKGIACRDLSDFFAYRDSMKMFIYRKNIDTAWQLLFDFNWQVGQKIKIPTLNWDSVQDSVEAEISFKGDTTINGKTLPMLRYIVGPSELRVVMNIGSIDDYFLPQYGLPITDVPTYSLRCYEDTIMGLAKAVSISSCDTSFQNTGVVRIDKQEQLAFPNPCNQTISIATKGNGTGNTLKVYNIIGEMVWEQRISNPTTNVSTNNWAEGYYHFIITGNSRTAQTGRFEVRH